MGTVSKIKTQRLLDPANGALEGQARVNAEIFTAVEILGRKLERVAAERDRLAQRLALIESQATLDEKTGKFYLPVVVNPEAPAPTATASTPRWVLAAALASVALALFSVATVLLRPAMQPLTENQIAVLNALSASQFTHLEPDSNKWKTLAEAQPPVSAPAPAASIATSAAPAQKAPALQKSASAKTASSALAVTPAEKQAMPQPPKTASATPAKQTPSEPPGAKIAEKTLAKPAVKISSAKAEMEPVLKPTGKAVPMTAAAGGIAPDKTLTGDLAALQKRAYEGVPAAEHDLATLYAAGNDVPQDYARARFWFTQAAEQGVANASYNLGVIYHEGLGVTPDMKKALYWYKKAAALGHPEAMYNLGISYIEGIGTKVDIPKGVAYFKRAAAAGVAQAAYNLGVLYESNFIGPINIPEALKWYRIAAKQGHPQATAALERLEGDAIKSGKTVAANSAAAQTAANITPAAGGNADGPHTLLSDIQRILIRQGFLNGKPDGVLSQQTQDAIAVAEKKLGMTPDGEPSQALLDKLLQMPPALGKSLP